MSLSDHFKTGVILKIAPPMRKYTDLKSFLNDFRAAHQKVETVEMKMVDNGYAMEVVTKIRGLEFHGVSYQGLPEFDSRRVGYLNGVELVLDKYCVCPKMEVSKEFMRLQHADLCYKTNEWMREFFGNVYPIYVVDGRIVMHPVTFNELQRHV